MKKATSVWVLLLALALLLSGCGVHTFAITSVGDNTTIKLDGIEDGATNEGGRLFSVRNGSVILVDSALEKGALRVDFAEAIVIYDAEDESEDYGAGAVAASVTVGAGDRKEVALAKGDYVMQLTAVGETSGTVTVKLEKTQ